MAPRASVKTLGPSSVAPGLTSPKGPTAHPTPTWVWRAQTSCPKTTFLILQNMFTQSSPSRSTLAPPTWPWSQILRKSPWFLNPHHPSVSLVLLLTIPCMWPLLSIFMVSLDTCSRTGPPLIPSGPVVSLSGSIQSHHSEIWIQLELESCLESLPWLRKPLPWPFRSHVMWTLSTSLPSSLATSPSGSATMAHLPSDPLPGSWF